MKKIFTLLLAGALFTGVQAQVTITYKVDVTNYDTNGNIDANGLRVGGNFAALNATAGGNALVDWSPSDANSAMTDEGNGVWSIEVTYPAESIGTEQLFKYVNGDWGTNEGTGNSNIAIDSCGLDDGAGNINRQFVITETPTTLIFCWDQCTQCDSSAAVLNVEEVKQSDMTVFPNPFQNEFTISSASNSAIANVTIMDLSGRVVANMAGQRATSMNISADAFGMVTGLYLVRVTAVDGTTALVKVAAQ
ncbi:MAG: T9SS type A sorting domain-containing protein [Flavobacteriales bacterium]|nr:T9SS type A sorting domain-containing protein [Flavobacteriales bacterium]